MLTVEFELDGQPFTALNGGPEFKFNEAISFQINCEDQDEVDRYWDELVEGGGEHGPCGWLKDRFGVSWQVIPTRSRAARRPGQGKAQRAMAGDDEDGQARGRRARARGGGRPRRVDLCDVRVAVSGAGPGPGFGRRHHAGAQLVVERGAVQLEAHLVELGLRVGAELEALLGDERHVARICDEPPAELLELRVRCLPPGQHAEVHCDFEASVGGRFNPCNRFVHAAPMPELGLT